MMAQVEVALWAGLKPLADGQDRVEVSATTIGELLDALVAKHPGLAAPIEEGVSVAINGKIMAIGLSAPIATGDEVVLLQRIKGG